MIDLVDIEKGLLNAAFKKRRHFTLFFFITIFTVLIDVILMITSNEKYVLELIFTIILSIAYLIYLVYYFTVIRRVIFDNLRFYEGANKSELNKLECKLNKIYVDQKENNGLNYFVLDADVKQDLEETNKNFLLPQKFEFRKGQKAILYTYGTVVIKVELK